MFFDLLIFMFLFIFDKHKQNATPAAPCCSFSVVKLIRCPVFNNAKVAVKSEIDLNTIEDILRQCVAGSKSKSYLIIFVKIERSE